MHTSLLTQQLIASILLAVSIFMLVACAFIAALFEKKRVTLTLCGSLFSIPSIVVFSYFSFVTNDNDGGIFAFCIMVYVLCYSLIGLGLSVDLEKDTAGK
jgi:ABC-type Mn2+/Zn2+ transport system permease subunit